MLLDDLLAPSKSHTGPVALGRDHRLVHARENVVGEHLHKATSRRVICKILQRCWPDYNARRPELDRTLRVSSSILDRIEVWRSRGIARYGACDGCSLSV